MSDAQRRGTASEIEQVRWGGSPSFGGVAVSTHTREFSEGVVMVRRGRDAIGTVGGAAGEASPRMASSTAPPPPPPCAISPKGAADLDDEESAVRAFDAALVRPQSFVWRY